MESPRLVIFMLIFSMLFAPLSYAFTMLGVDEPTEYIETGLDSDAIISLGLTIANSQYENVTFEGGWFYYELNTLRVRVRWVNATEDYFEFDSQSHPIEIFANTWFLPTDSQIIKPDGLGLSRNGTIKETDVISYYQSVYHWTRFIIKEFALNLFFAPDNNTISIIDQLDSGTIKVVMARVTDETDNFNFLSFVNWYWNLITGQNTFGLPPIFSWIIRIITAIQFVCAVWVTKDLLRV